MHERRREGQHGQAQHGVPAMPTIHAFRRPEGLRARVALWLRGLRRWLAYRPERSYMRGRQHG